MSFKNENICLKFKIMKKKLTLLIFLFPLLLMAQTTIKKDGTITFDFGKKNKQQQQDSTPPPPPSLQPDDEDEDQPKSKKERKQARVNGGEQEEIPDFKKDGIFKAILHAGINGAQIDGDGYAGYNHIGADVGIGAMIRFHKYFSATMEINYSMKGAKQKLVQQDQRVIDSTGNSSLFQYRANLDYIEVPISLNVQDKKYVMFSLGLSMAALVRYKERTEAGQDDTNNPPNGQPKSFDFCAFGALNFIIHKNYMLGIKFSYSLISLRGVQYPGLSRASGEFNNVLNFHFAYIIDKSTFKKKANR
ncbi:MAG: hypothetical protein JWO06_1435 [Bacteroidota bacterium]|nr:hypothetical protein [Bacteroidota bacterium]